MIVIEFIKNKLLGLPADADAVVSYADRDAAWELYNLIADGSETHNLADQHPERVKAMAVRWEQWAHRAQVLPQPTPPAPKKKKGK